MRPLILILFISITALLSCNNTGNVKSEMYQCSMKCEDEKTYDESGSCSVCGMQMQKVKTENTVESNNSKVKIAGAMMNVMHKGELFGTINLDTISNRQHLYGLGPIEYLRGEILIVDGISYISKVAADGSIQMEETYQAKAPFFVSENVEKWQEIKLPDSVQNISQLETYLDLTTKSHSRPFAFKLTATIDSCAIHIVNLPEGAEVHSPDEAHQNQKIFSIKNQNADLIGFFSTEHAGIFTHHDTYVHIHLITTDKKQMGHLDELLLAKGTAKLYLPLD